MSKIFQFGEDVEEYDFKVINERDARASAGIMFALGLISLFSLFLTKNLFWANLFTITFIIEFFVRTLVNPKYAPYMILGSLIVSNQQPDWVEAKPKKFAWLLGVGLALIMSYFILFNIFTPFRLLTCVLCLILLFTESAFGICLGCIVYKKLNKKLYKCPGGVCEVPLKKENKLNKILILIFFMLIFFGTYKLLKQYKDFDTSDANFSGLTQEQKDMMEFGKDDESEDVIIKSEIKPTNEDCTPPQWAIDMGHRDIWLEHHNCKK